MSCSISTSLGTFVDIGVNMTDTSYCIVDVGGVLNVDTGVHVISTMVTNGFNAKAARREFCT